MKNKYHLYGAALGVLGSVIIWITLGPLPVLGLLIMFTGNNLEQRNR